MNVNEIYNLIKNDVCLQCRKDLEDMSKKYKLTVELRAGHGR